MTVGAVDERLNEEHAMNEMKGIVTLAVASVLFWRGRSGCRAGQYWRFPYMTGENGGAAFIVIYRCRFFLLGYPLMVNETVTGTRSQRDPVGAFKQLLREGPWWLVGVLGFSPDSLFFLIILSGGMVARVYLQIGYAVSIRESTMKRF
jgi:hypothetical protein